jgi:hypothetical protein
MLSTSFSCTGCNEPLTVQSSHPVDIEWERYVVGGGYLGWVICTTHEVIERLEVDTLGIAGSWGIVGGGSFFGQRLTCAHECSGSGNAGNRAPVAPGPFQTEPQGSADTAI